MYLLARAQAFETVGRTTRSIMLQRLAGMGVASDAAANDDFQLSHAAAAGVKPDLLARIEGLSHPQLSLADCCLPNRDPGPNPGPDPGTDPGTDPGHRSRPHPPADRQSSTPSPPNAGGLPVRDPGF